MVPVRVAIQRSIRKHARAFLLAAPISLLPDNFHVDDRRAEDTPEAKLPSGEWVRCTVQLNPLSRQAELGINPRYRVTGVVIFQVFGLPNDSSSRDRLNDIAARLEGRYTSTSIVSGLNSRPITFFTASTDDLGVVKGSQQANVVCPFYFDYQKSDLP